jgi:hypothetical protein
LLIPAVLRSLPHPLIQRFHPAHEIARLVGRPRERILLRGLAHCARGVGDLALQPLEVRADRLLHAARVLRAGAVQRVLGVADHLADLLVADAGRGVVELA